MEHTAEQSRHAAPDTPATIDEKPKCVGCHSWRSVSLMKTGCPSCLLVGLVILPFSLIGSAIRRLTGR